MIRIDKKSKNKIKTLIENNSISRNYGLDLFKIILTINNINNPKFKPAYLLYTFSFFPLNTFGLISGIIGYKKYKYENLIYLWFE